VIVKATSDLHGDLPHPALDVGACDLLLVAGDVCPAWDHSLEFQLEWLNNEWAEWLEEVQAKQVVWIAGNHDFVLQEVGKSGSKGEFVDELIAGGVLPPWTTYLCDGWCEVLGLKIYGTPWSLGPDVSGWAFEAQERSMGPTYDKPGAVDMANVVNDIPSDADVVISHGPASGFGDRVGGPNGIARWLGSEALTGWVREHEPRLCVFGHNHEGYGRWSFPGKDDRGMELANVSWLTDSYRAGQHPVMEFEL